MKRLGQETRLQLVVSSRDCSSLITGPWTHHAVIPVPSTNPTTEIVRVTVDRIQTEVASEYGVTVEGLKSRKRTKNLTVPRQIAMLLCRQLTDLPLVEIGQAFGGRDHTTVIHACDKVETEIGDNRAVRMRIEQLRDRIAS